MTFKYCLVNVSDIIITFTASLKDIYTVIKGLGHIVQKQ